METSLSAIARSSTLVTLRRPSASARRSSSGSPGSWNGGSPRAIVSTRARSLSTQVTVWPSDARQVPVTRPTYPVPTIATLMSTGERLHPPRTLAPARSALDLPRGRGHLERDSTRRAPHPTLDAGAGRDGDQVAGREPVRLARGDLEVANLPVDHDLVLGYLGMPVIAAVVAGLVPDDD